MTTARRLTGGAVTSVAANLAARGLCEVAGYGTGRDRVDVGDAVRCRPIKGRAFAAHVRRILADLDGQIVEVDVFGGPTGRPALRTFTPERILPQPNRRRREEKVP